MKITIWDVYIVIQYSPKGLTFEHEETVAANTRREAIRALIKHDGINPRMIYRSGAIEKETVLLGGVI